MLEPVRRTFTPGLVGRQEEFAGLEQAWALAREDQPGLVVLGGDAGIGKSRLVNELQPRVVDDGGLWLVGSTPSRGSVAQPFAPLTGSLRSLFRQLDPAEHDGVIGPARAELARLLPELGPAGGAPAAFDQLSNEPARLFELLLGVLERLTVDRPVGLVFEDVHWAESSTLHLIEFLARNLIDIPVLVVLTYRTDEMHRTHPLRPVLAELRRLPSVVPIAVEPLDRDEVAAMVAHLSDGPVADDVVDRLAERSGGVPFFVEELIAADACETCDELPPELQELLRLRIDALDAPVLDVVRARPRS